MEERLPRGLYRVHGLENHPLAQSLIGCYALQDNLAVTRLGLQGMHVTALPAGLLALFCECLLSSQTSIA
jgi:hypothetical protein